MNEAATPAKTGLNAEEVDFVASLLTANASWSASIHNAALDGQERASNQWAARYLRLVEHLDTILLTTTNFERDTFLYDRLRDALGSQSFYPAHAGEQIERYRERLAEEKAAASAGA